MSWYHGQRNFSDWLKYGDGNSAAAGSSIGAVLNPYASCPATVGVATSSDLICVSVVRNFQPVKLHVFAHKSMTAFRDFPAVEDFARVIHTYDSSAVNLSGLLYTVMRDNGAKAYGYNANSNIKMKVEGGNPFARDREWGLLIRWMEETDFFGCFRYPAQKDDRSMEYMSLYYWNAFRINEDRSEPVMSFLFALAAAGMLDTLEKKAVDDAWFDAAPSEVVFKWNSAAVEKMAKSRARELEQAGHGKVNREQSIAGRLLGKLREWLDTDETNIDPKQEAIEKAGGLVPFYHADTGKVTQLTLAAAKTLESMGAGHRIIG